MIHKVFPLLLSLVLLQYADGQKDEQGNFFRKDYTYLSKNFYKFHTMQKSWLQARKICQREGADLFYPEDETEADAVLDWWNRTQPIGWIHVGITALVVKGVFETIDGQPITSVYNKWRPGEPNDLGGEEDCVVMFREGGFYNDEACNKAQSFICKKTLASLKYNSFCDLPDPEYKYNAVLNSCYKFHLDPMNWTEAYTVCNMEQSHLAIIDSPAEAEYLVKLTAEAPKDKVSGNYLRGAVHLGFHNRDMGGWRTIKGKALESTHYPYFEGTQPDGGDSELCGSFFYTGQLNDIGCFQNMFFICEHELLSFEGFDFRVGIV